MKRYTQEEFDSMPVDEFGVKNCPSGDYTLIEEFGKRCSFGEYCSFGVSCSFGDDCSFGKCCSFGDDCSFGKCCIFGVCCEWLYFPQLIDFANMRDLSAELTCELMHRDAESHPRPEMFDAWANGGVCPYSIPVQRRHWFKELSHCWNMAFPRMTTADLIRAVAKEKNWIIKEF